VNRLTVLIVCRAAKRLGQLPTVLAAQGSPGTPHHETERDGGCIRRQRRLSQRRGSGAPRDTVVTTGSCWNAAAAKLQGLQRSLVQGGQGLLEAGRQEHAIGYYHSRRRRNGTHHNGEDENNGSLLLVIANSTATAAATAGRRRECGHPTADDDNRPMRCFSAEKKRRHQKEEEKSIAMARVLMSYITVLTVNGMSI